MPAIDPRLVIVFVWVALCALVAWRLLTRRPSTLPGIGYAILAAFLVRTIPALILDRGARYEMHVFQQAAEALLDGQNIYQSTIPYPYLPFQLYWFAIAEWLARHVGLFYIFWLKLAGILAETAITALVYRGIQRSGEQTRALLGSWLYAVNPVTIMVAAYQGQFDALPVLSMVAAWYFSEFHSSKRWGLTLSACLLGLGILSKTWPVILLPIIILRLPRWDLRLRYAVTAGVIPIAGTLFYELLFPGSLVPIARRVIHAGAIPGWWGYSAVMNAIVELTGQGGEIYAFLVKVGKLVALAGGGATIYLTRRRSTLQSLVLTILVLFTAVPNLGLQGLSWLVPLAVILGSFRQLAWYIAGATIHMMISYWGIHLTDGLYLLLPDIWASIIIQLSSLTAWGSIVIWFAHEIHQTHLIPRIPRR